MKVKTNELKERALDWAVAKCAGIELLDPHNNEWELCWTLLGDNSGDYYTPSTNWAQGGPIIEREGLTLSHSPYDHVFYGRTRPWCAEKKGRMEYGPTPLIAAMRCYVASKLGDTVELPTELLP
jgi:hypothetical protein